MNLWTKSGPYSHLTVRAALPAVLAGCALTLALAPSASAKLTDPFTPRLTVSSSTSQAGAHPDLTIEMHKTRDGCPGFATSCDAAQGYLEQDLKKMVMHLPPGLVADANAAPYCGDVYESWLPQGGGLDLGTLLCTNPGSLVGTIFIVTTMCGLGINDGDLDKFECYTGGIPDFPGALFAAPGLVYNAAPEAGEQGHLIVLWPKVTGPDADTVPSQLRTDISIKVRGSDQGIDAVADNIPDYLTTKYRFNGGPPLSVTVLGQASDIVMTLFGSTGIEGGHPLLTSASFCDPQSTNVEFEGYADNSTYDYNTGTVTLGSGDGTTVADSAPYQATGCDQVPYDPKLSLSLDNSSPDQSPAITSTVSQAQGEATTKKVTVSFPKAFKINDKNKSTFCSESDIVASVDDPGDQDRCAESSRIGTVEASSPVLPIGQTLKGNVYLGGLSGDSIKVSAVLHGFIDLRIDAHGTIAQDGKLVTTFDNLPAVPIGQFKLNLEGGDKGLIKTPKVCAPQSVTSTFQSHSGKTATVAAPLDISGCADPTLDATLSSRRPGAPTDLDLDLRSKGMRLKDVQLLLARQLHWQAGQAFATRAKSRAIGSVTFTTSTGELETALAAKRTNSGGVKLGALAPTTPSGQLGASQVPSFAGSLFRTTKRQATRKAKGNRKAQRVTPQAELDLFGLPQEDLTAVDLALKSKGNFSLRNPKGCGKPLNFVAFVTTADGRHLALKDQVRLKGKGC